MLGRIRHFLFQQLERHIVTYFFIILIFMLGSISGSMAVKFLPDEQKNELVGYLQHFFLGLNQASAGMNAPITLFPVLLQQLKTGILLWLLGFTVIGIPFVIAIVFTRGFVIGFAVGFLVNAYVAKGLLFALTAVLPHNLIAVPALWYLAVTATGFSVMLVRQRLPGAGGLWYAALAYSGQCLVAIVFLCFAGMVEVYISPVLMRGIGSLLFP